MLEVAPQRVDVRGALAPEHLVAEAFPHVVDLVDRMADRQPERRGSGDLLVADDSEALDAVGHSEHDRPLLGEQRLEAAQHLLGGEVALRMHDQLPPRIEPDPQRLAQLGLLVRERAAGATVQVGLSQRGGEVLDRAVRLVGDPDHVVVLIAGAGRHAERGGKLGREGSAHPHRRAGRAGERTQQPMFGRARELPDAGVVHRGAAPHRELAQRARPELRDTLGLPLAQPGRRIRGNPRGGERARQHVHVRLDEARQHGVACEVDDFGAGGVVTFDLREGANAEDRGAANRERLPDRMGIVHRKDRPASQNCRALGLGILLPHAAG